MGWGIIGGDEIRFLLSLGNSVGIDPDLVALSFQRKRVPVELVIEANVFSTETN